MLTATGALGLRLVETLTSQVKELEAGLGGCVFSEAQGRLRKLGTSGSIVYNWHAHDHGSTDSLILLGGTHGSR